MQIIRWFSTYSQTIYCSSNISILVLLLVLPVIGFPQIRSVQNSLTQDYFQVGLDAGITIFFGDIDNGPANGGLLQNNMAYKLHVGRNFGSLLLINGQISIGGISGEKNRDDVYWYFKGGFVEYTFGVGINTVALFKRDLDNLIAFYVNFGIGLIDIKTTRYDGITHEIVQTFGHGDQKATTEMVIPLGASLIFNISPHSSVSIQTTISRVDTDKMDALEGNNNRDYYNYTSIGYVYKIFSEKKGSISRNKPPVKKKRK